jgi:hypothetical protein
MLELSIHWSRSRHQPAPRRIGERSAYLPTGANSSRQVGLLVAFLGVLWIKENPKYFCLSRFDKHMRRRFEELAGATGLEPAASAVTVQRLPLGDS